MAISSFKCNLARIRSGLKSLITHHNIVVQTVNTINDDVQKLKANGGSGGNSNVFIVNAEKIQVDEYDEDGTIKSSYYEYRTTQPFEEIMSAYHDGNKIIHMIMDDKLTDPESPALVHYPMMGAITDQLIFVNVMSESVFLLTADGLTQANM